MVPKSNMLKPFVTFVTLGVAVSFVVSLLAIGFYSELSDWSYGTPIVPQNLKGEFWLLAGAVYLGHSFAWAIVAGAICIFFLVESGRADAKTIAITVTGALIIVSALAPLVIPGFDFTRLPIEKVASSYLQHFAVSIPSTAIAGLICFWWINQRVGG